MKVIVKIRTSDPVPKGGKFLHAKEEAIGYKNSFGLKQDCLSWLWVNPNYEYTRVPIMGTVLYYEVDQSEKETK